MYIHMLRLVLLLRALFLVASVGMVDQVGNGAEVHLTTCEQNCLEAFEELRLKALWEGRTTNQVANTQFVWERAPVLCKEKCLTLHASPASPE